MKNNILYCGFTLRNKKKTAVMHLVRDKDLLPCDIYFYSEHVNDKTKKDNINCIRLKKNEMIKYLKQESKAFKNVKHLICKL